MQKGGRIGVGLGAGKDSRLHLDKCRERGIPLKAAAVIGPTRRDIAVLQRTKPQACLKLMMGVVDVIGAKMREAQNEYRHYIAWRLGAG